MNYTGRSEGGVTGMETSWANIFVNLGLGGGLLLFICWGIYKIVAWIGPNVIIPLRERLLARLDMFFAKLEKNLDGVESTLARIQVSLDEKGEYCRDHRITLEQIALKLKAQTIQTKPSGK